jgi:hypothetical protein
LIPGAAGAATTSTSDIPSAVDQYVEISPAANGKATLANVTTPLSQGAARALETVNRPVAAALTEVATSSAFGAPSTKLARLASTGSARVSSASFVGSLEEMGRSILGGGDRLLGVLVGLVVISVAAAVIARKKNRSAI